MSEATRMTEDGKRLVDAWERSKAAVADAEKTLAEAQKQHELDGSALGQWMLPVDANLGEKFCVWLGSRLVCVHIRPLNEFGPYYVIEIRGSQRP